MANIGQFISLGFFFLCTGGSTNITAYAPIIIATLLNRAAGEKNLLSKSCFLNVAGAIAMGVYSAQHEAGNTEIKLTAFLVFSSFFVPLVRNRLGAKRPDAAAHAVRAMILSCLVLVWMFEGADSLFLGIFFFHAVPEIQRPCFQRGKLHFLLVSTILLVFSPCLVLVGMLYFAEESIQYYPPRLISFMVTLMGAGNDIPDHYGALGLHAGATDKTIKSVFRKLALQYHPDKVGNDRRKLAEFVKLQTAMETLTKPELRREYDNIFKNGGLHALIPRSVVATVLCGVWMLITVAVLLQQWWARRNQEKALKAELEHRLQDPEVQKLIREKVQEAQAAAIREGKPLPSVDVQVQFQLDNLNKPAKPVAVEDDSQASSPKSKDDPPVKAAPPTAAAAAGIAAAAARSSSLQKRKAGRTKKA